MRVKSSWLLWLCVVSGVVMASERSMRDWSAYGLVSGWFTVHSSSVYLFHGGDDRVDIDLSDRTIFVYSPGDNIYRDFIGDYECQLQWTPPVLSGILEQVPGSVLVRVCPQGRSQVVNDVLSGHYQSGQAHISPSIEKLHKRADDLDRMLDGLLAKGARAERIYLVGHSFGGWVSMLVGSRSAAKIGGVIVSAPAMSQRFDWDRVNADRVRNGPLAEVAELCGEGAQAHRAMLSMLEYERSQFAQLQQVEIERIRAGRQMLRAMVFVYPGDEYVQPRDLSWLHEFDQVQLVEDVVDDGHATIYGQEFSRRHLDRLVVFVGR